MAAKSVGTAPARVRLRADGRLPAAQPRQQSNVDWIRVPNVQDIEQVTV